LSVFSKGRKITSYLISETSSPRSRG